MGLFDKLVKVKSNADQQQLVQHKEEWDFDFSNVNDVLGSIFVDLGLSKIAPLKDKPNLIWISIKMKNPREDGLSSNEEYDKLKDLEDRLVNSILEKHNTIYAGRVTSNGERDFFFYARDLLLYDKTVSEALIAFPGYEYDFGTKDEPGWSTYFDLLYPLPSQLQSLQNRRVLDNLEKHGDNLSKERRVDHWIFFKSEIDRASFLAKIEGNGFEVVDCDYNKRYGDAPYKLRISRVDKVDYNSVDDYVLELWRHAKDCNGEYDGWETSVEKD